MEMKKIELAKEFDYLDQLSYLHIFSIFLFYTQNEAVCV